MELHQLWKVLRRRWWLVAIPSVTAFVYAAVVFIQSPPRGGYSTQIRFAAAPPPGVDVSGLGYEDSRYFPWKTGEFVVDGLTAWAPSTTFADEVSLMLEEQGLDIPTSAIYGHISADNERSVMTVYIDWSNRAELEAIADAAIDVMQVRHAEYFPQLGSQGAVVTALDAIAVRREPPSIGARLDPIIRFGLGLVLGLALALGVDYIDPAVRDRQEVEALGLTVLAEIPRHRVS
jgi:capsular polysaccharide biosynthesis protein